MTELSKIARAKRWNKRAYTLIALYTASLFLGTFIAQSIDPSYGDAFGLFYIVWSVVAILGTLICAVRSLNLVGEQNSHAKYLITVSILLGAIFAFIVVALKNAGGSI
ncbi:MAG: hypothetical protein Q4G44_02975 [Alcaligenaceae bacterium]|nr:hypothetical protein [Alcaligenaceae bacterium]